MDTFDRGIELFNAGKYFEAHEEWEKLWQGESKDSPPKMFVQGLIMAAAALDHVGKGRVDGALRLLDQCLERLEANRSIGSALIDVEGLIRGLVLIREAIGSINPAAPGPEMPRIIRAL